MSALFGRQHRELVEQLVNWWQTGPPVAFLEGFPGVGKSNAILPEVRQRLVDLGAAITIVDAPAAGRSQVDDLLLDLAQELSVVGADELVQAVDEGAGRSGLLLGLQRALRRPLLVTLDEAQHLLHPESGEPVGAIQELLARIAHHVDWPGRLLLITNRMPRRGRWSDPHAFFTIKPFAADDALAFLGQLLTGSGRETEVSQDRRADVVAWVGGNPRALKLIVAALGAAPLDELIGIEPELWELRDREVSRSLLENLERELLRKVVVQLPPFVRDGLALASVYRKPVRREAWDVMLAGPKEGELARRELVDRFLLEHQRGWFALNPVAREVARARLEGDDRSRRRAHSLAGEHYARHFRARELTGGGRLGGHYVEARYHLVQAGREEELSEVVGRFLAHLTAEIKFTSAIPMDPRELDERIAVLAAALEGGGPKALEYHLARCFDRRGGGLDRERALQHVRLAIGPHAPSGAWALLIRLEGELSGGDAAVLALRQAKKYIPPSQNLFALYRAAGETFVRQDRLDDAVAVLKQGIAEIPPGYNLFALYNATGEILVRQGKLDDAVNLLKQGIKRVPPEHSLVSLYNAAGEILARQGKLNDAVDLLKQGIETIPPESGLFSVYRTAGEVLSRHGRLDDAVDLLKQGIKRIPSEHSLFSLYSAAGEILTLQGKLDDATDLLKQGIEKIPPEHGLVSLYSITGEILSRQGKLDDAVDLLKQGIEKIPPEHGLVSLYSVTGEILGRQGKIIGAVDLFKQAMAKVPTEYGLFSLYEAAGESLAHQGKVDDAVDLLRQGTDKVTTDFNLFILYQTAGAALAFQGKLDSAVSLLCDGLRKIPNHVTRNRLAESAVMLAAASGRRDLLAQVMALATAPRTAVASAFSRLLDDDCAGAIAGLQEIRRRFPKYVTASLLEAFSHLAAGDPRSARQVLSDTRGIYYRQGQASTWLAALVALGCGDEEDAHRLFAAYRGQSVEVCPPPDKRALLAAWNGPMGFMKFGPAYYFPVLPSGLTGLLYPIVRSTTGKPAPELAALLAVTEHRRSGPIALAIATEWSSHHGGLSTLNRELCQALAHAGLEVVCWVPRAASHEIAAAKEAGVLLLPAPPLPAADDLATLSQRPPLPANLEPDLLIGHGRITGAAAKSLGASFFPRADRLHFVHMAPGEIEWFKTRDGASSRAEQREKQELDLAMGARLAVAIGPRLEREVGNLLASRLAAPPVHRLDPGLSPGNLRTPPPGIQVLLLGRAEDLELKGIDIAAAAIARLPASAFEAEPILVIRGAPRGTGDELRRQLLAIAPVPGDRLRVREYTADTDDLLEDLRRSSLLLLPSRSEGFGLVALEALAAGTPILVSDRSGIGELLREHLKSHEESRWIVRTTGSLGEDADEWSRAIAFTLQDRHASFERTHDLAIRIAAEVDWARSVRALLAVLSVQVPRG
jgi:tetratricopeptide (TPR) repeat protein/glycosyltransferase involved in cell wall biosynthesis